MSTNVTMPQMGESVFEGTITRWLKKVGETVSRDEPLLEISTDKVDSEIPAPASGVLAEILAAEGETVKVNTVLARIESGSAAQEPKAEPAKAVPAAAEPEQPAESEKAAPTAEVEPQQTVEPQAAEPAEEEPPAAFEESYSEAVAEEVKGRERAAKAPVSAKAEEKPVVEAAPAVEARPKPAEGPKEAETPGAARPRDVRTSPLVRRMAREHGVDLADVKGSGLSGRITKDDMLRYIAERERAAAPSPEKKEAEEKAAEAPRPEPVERAEARAPKPSEAAREARPAAVEHKPAPAPEAPSFAGETQSVTMTPMRKAIAERMVASKHTSAHVHTVFEVDMSALVRLRDRHKEEFLSREGFKLTFTPFFVKALVDAVREFPILNSSVSGDEIIYKKPINVGIAVALETGLIVPVVKNAHLKSFTGLAIEIHDLAERARSKKLSADDVQQGTITITNHGIFGSLVGTPIINQPQVAILGIGKIEKRVVVVEDAIAIRPMAYLALSFDHRVIDGAVADRFMAAIQSRLQSWTQWVE